MMNIVSDLEEELRRLNVTRAQLELASAQDDMKLGWFFLAVAIGHMLIAAVLVSRAEYASGSILSVMSAFYSGLFCHSRRRLRRATLRAMERMLTQ